MKPWPTHFDLHDDPENRKAIKSFIEIQMQELKKLDQARISWAKNNLPSDYEVTYLFFDHSYRVAKNIKNTALYMGLGELAAENLYWATLPHDIGKTNLPIEIWDAEGKPDEAMKTQRRQHTATGVEIVESELGHINHPFKDLMIDIMYNHHEKMDGTGHHKVPGEKLSLPTRLACIADSFDGWRIRRPHYGTDRDTSIKGVLKRMKKEKGAEFFDMDLVKQFSKMKKAELKRKTL